MEILKTKDYGIFKHIEGNREVKKGKVKNLCKSVSQVNLMPYNPIIVTKDLHVVDGQHRLECCKIMGIPVYYVMMQDEDADKAMEILNRYQTQWRQEDFLTLGASKVGGCYEELKKFNDTNDFLGISNAMVIYPDKQINSTIIKSMKAEFGKNPNADKIVAYLKSAEIQQLPSKIKNSRSFVLAIRKAFDVYSEREMYKLRRKALFIPRCADYNQYLTVFYNLINKK